MRFSAGLAAVALYAVRAKIEVLEKAESALPPTYPSAFPRGVLNPAWANNKKFLREARRHLRHGQPVVIPDFLAPPVAEALSEHLQKQAETQDDDRGRGFPFRRWSEGPEARGQADWKLTKPKPCSRIVEDFMDRRGQQYAVASHVLVAREKGSHDPWFAAFANAMKQPAMHRFWQNLTDLPEWAQEYDSSWSWLRRGDYHGLHADDSQMRYLSLTIHLTREWHSQDGGEFIWCGPDGRDDGEVESPRRPHFHRSSTASRNGTVLVPEFNTAIVFPVFRNSNHAVAPVKAAKGQRFTLQGWYVDPCHFKPPDHKCVKRAMGRLQRWSEEWAKRATNTQPPARLVTQSMPEGYFSEL